jgi:membrane protease YdiL (CAAX protease family)
MSPNSSSTTGEQPPVEEKVAVRRPRSFSRRFWLAILLPVWVAVGFYLSQVLLIAPSIALHFMGIPLFEGINMAVLNAVLAALVYLLTVVIVIGLPYVIRKSRTTMAGLGLSRLPVWQDILLAPAGFVVYLLAAGVLITLASKVIPGFNAEQSQDVGFQDLTRGYEYILAFLTLVVIAPVAEEVLMRGYLYGKLRKIMPVALAMVETALLFGFLHMQWNVAVDVFALSLVLTSLREVSGSIWASILLHMMKNGLAFYLLFINTTLFHTMGG